MRRRVVAGVIVLAVSLFAADALSVGAAGISAMGNLEEDKDVRIFKPGQALVLYKEGEGDSEKKALKALGVDGVKVEKLWQFEGESAGEEKGAVQSRSAKESKAQSADAQNISIGLVSSESMTTEKLVERLSSKENVELAEPNYRIYAQTDDTYYKKQWNLENTGQNGGTAGSSVNVGKKWETVKGSGDVVVAVLDTGVDYEHEDLRENIWENPYAPTLKGEHGFDFVNGDNDPMDDNGHGTHCAGIIGAAGENQTGISGVNQKVKIMPLKILDEDGEAYASEAVDAYNYINRAMSLGVKVAAVNNSWGGGEKSEIFEKLMQRIGERGAVSVCAAGNSSKDKDTLTDEDEEDYPAAYDSAYKLSVASSDHKNELSSFSDYGKNTVDLAAPGNCILSTVSYDCYNPSLYSDEKQKKLSGKFEDFEGGENGGSDWAEFSEEEIGKYYVNTNGKDTSGYQAELTGDVYFGEGAEGKSLKLTFEGLAAGECAGISIPYTLGEDENEIPRSSMMVSAKGPARGEESVLLMMDVPAGSDFPDSLVELLSGSEEFSGIGVTDKADDWVHLELVQPEGAAAVEKNRELRLFFMTEKKGDYCVYLDDVGLSESGIHAAEFGKYDFNSGTSMAAPHVTGAVALAAAQNPKSTSVEKVTEVLTHVRKTQGLKDKTIAGGVLDFSAENKEIAPKIGEVSADIKKGQIIIKGVGLDAPDLKALISKSGKEDAKEAKILQKTKEKVILQADGWINHLVDITVTGYERSSTKKEVYLSGGQRGYSAVGGIDFDLTGSICTDGSNIYLADSYEDSISMLDLSDLEYAEGEYICEIQPSRYFKKDTGSYGTYDFIFGKDLVYMDGWLYNVAAYSEVGGADDEEEGEGGGPGSAAAYSSQYKLFAVSPEEGRVLDLGALPSQMRQTEDWTLAAYNGRLYLMGGYDYKNKTCSTSVYVYTPSVKKWTKGTSLPEGRAGGKALQSGGRLIYTLGYGEGQEGLSRQEQECPAALVWDGSRWKTSAQKLEIYGGQKEVIHGSRKYLCYEAGLGICAEGLVYAGVPAAGLGDTFVYRADKDLYQAMDRGLSKEISESAFSAISVGGMLYVSDEAGRWYRTPVNSGLVKVSVKKLTAGKIVNGNKGFVPGTAVRLTAKPKKGYAVKTFTVDGKKVKGWTKTVRLTKNGTASASFGKAIKKLTLSKKKVTLKAGKTYKLKVKISPKNACNKKLTYTSSNKKYATVSSKGVIKAKKAGKGKTVTITVKTTDGSKKYAKCKVKIRR